MKIIILNGKGNCGKTTVLKKLYAKIVADSRFSQIYFKKEEPLDLSAMFECNGKKIGLTTLGDGERDLKGPFDIFIKENCDLVVCACRSRDTKNGAVSYIKSLTADLIWYKKAYVEAWKELYGADEEIDKINELQAEILLKEMLEQLK